MFPSFHSTLSSSTNRRSSNRVHIIRPRCRLCRKSSMASKIIAQIIIQGTAIFSRAFVAAYTQALQNAKAGGTAPNIAKITKHKMQTDEALKILGFEGRKSLNPQVLTEKYTKLFEANGLKGGSFYLQSKIYRAKEALDTELSEETKKDEKKPDDSRKAK